MGMARREQQRRQEELFIAHPELPRTVVDANERSGVMK